MTKSILAIGGIYVDINCHGVKFKGSIPAETELDGSDYEVLAGGSGVNFGRLCKQLGLRPAFLGKIGDDPMGDFAEKLLREAGILPMLIRDPEVSTQIAMNLVNDHGETVMPGSGNANRALGPEDVLKTVEAHIKDIDYLYLGTCLKLRKLLPAYPEIARLAKQHGTRIIVDHGRVTAHISPADIDQVKELVKLADFYIPSADEFCKVWQVGSIEGGLRKLQQLSPAQVIVKDGKNGAFALDNDTILQAKAFDVTARYLVGAGDSFNAGFITASSQGKPLEDSMDYANAVAALKVSGAAVTQAAAEDLIVSRK